MFSDYGRNTPNHIRIKLPGFLPLLSGFSSEFWDYICGEETGCSFQGHARNTPCIVYAYFPGFSHTSHSPVGIAVSGLR